MASESTARWDLILVGGGLQNGLIALATLAARPDAKVLLIEKADALGGNHTWSFHLESIPPEARAWFEPLIEHRWPRYAVKFPDLSRTLEHAYATCSSERFAAIVATRMGGAPNAELRLGVEVVEVGPSGVRTGGGEVIEGRLVVDARGPRERATSDSGYQKFVGLEVELEAPIDDQVALLMDATVPQRDAIAGQPSAGAFRFVYVLPFSPTRALVEDTYFANDATLDIAGVRARVMAYLGDRGMRVVRVLREEHGVLPMPWRAAGPVSRKNPLVAGYRGGWFHPATGYSVPVALRLACFIAARAPEDVFGAEFDRLADGHEKEARFGHLLNELLFTATEPAQRWKVFRHFYELPDDVTLRFYGMELTAADKRKMFLRRPPPGVNFLKAMRILPSWGLR
ncbi:MAG: lycopene beta-cyclase CrtY [Deltaproteobacteria bacterium]|nr:lycopene beta-cyclase CrtY [Deltaproteobacteria bacterium]